LLAQWQSVLNEIKGGHRFESDIKNRCSWLVTGQPIVSTISRARCYTLSVIK